MNGRLTGICEDAEVVIYLRRRCRTQQIFLLVEGGNGRDTCLACIDVPLDTGIEVIEEGDETWIRWHDDRDQPQELYCDRVDRDGYDDRKEAEE